MDGVKEPSSGRTGEAHRREGFQLGYVSTRDELLKVEDLCSEYIKGGRHGYHDEALMGMGIESVRVQEGRFEILSPGAYMTLHADGMLNVRQRIGAERELLSCRLPEHLSPWRLACQQAKEILSAYDKSDLFIGLLDLNADVYIYKANKVEVLYDVEKGRIEGTDARSRIEGVLDENQAVQQKAEKLLSRLLSPLTVKEMLKEWFGRDREILVDATSTTN